jgi:hypothetical protein
MIRVRDEVVRTQVRVAEEWDDWIKWKGEASTQAVCG